MKSFSGTILFAFLVFLGCSIFFGTISCNTSPKKPTFPNVSQKIKDSLIEAWTTCCPGSDSPGPLRGPRIICPENPGDSDAIAFIRQQFDSGHVSLPYYPVLTPKMIHVLDSLNKVRGSSAPNYYAFVFENDSTQYTVPISKAEIDSGKLTSGDSFALLQIYDPPACYYPHCAAQHVLIIKDTFYKK